MRCLVQRAASPRCHMGLKRGCSSSSIVAAAAAAAVRPPLLRDVRAAARRTASTGGTAVKKVPAVEQLEWSTPLRVLRYPDPRLRAPNARIADAAFGPQLRELARQMMEVMYSDDGVGLAAPQLGLNLRLLVFNETAEPGAPEETVLVNPVIVERGRAMDVDVEGCLSFPRIYADVERHTKVEIEYQDLDGRPQRMVLRGFAARVFQHEYDHLQGVLYFDRMKPAALAKVRPAIVALEETYIAAHPGAQVERLPPAAAAGAPAAKARGFGGFGGGAAKR